MRELLEAVKTKVRRDGHEVEVATHLAAGGGGVVVLERRDVSTGPGGGPAAGGGGAGGSMDSVKTDENEELYNRIATEIYEAIPDENETPNTSAILRIIKELSRHDGGYIKIIKVFSRTLNIVAATKECTKHLEGFLELVTDCVTNKLYLVMNSCFYVLLNSLYRGIDSMIDKRLLEDGEAWMQAIKQLSSELESIKPQITKDSLPFNKLFALLGNYDPENHVELDHRHLSLMIVNAIILRNHIKISEETFKTLIPLVPESEITDFLFCRSLYHISDLNMKSASEDIKQLLRILQIEFFNTPTLEKARGNTLLGCVNLIPMSIERHKCVSEDDLDPFLQAGYILSLIIRNEPPNVESLKMEKSFIRKFLELEGKELSGLVIASRC